MSKNRFLWFVLFLWSGFSLAQSNTSPTYDIGKLTDPESALKNAELFNNSKNRKQSTKASSSLIILHTNFKSHSRQRSKQRFESSNPGLRLQDDMVLVDFIADKDSERLLLELEKMGLKSGSSYGRVISGWLPLSAIDKLEDLTSLRFARESHFLQNTGSVTSRGDAAQLSDDARTNFSVDGSGITVGVLSDSYNCLGGAPADIASGDLPNTIQVLDDSFCVGAIDEGRAMLQHVYDVAPGADLAFHTASGGQANFANGIVELATLANADVIVDDIFYFAEPFFQDGIVAQAVETVTDLGVTYVSSAGNQARDSYESVFRNSGVAGAVGTRHDFDPGPGVNTLQTITLPPGDTPFSLQWDQPFFSVSGAPGSTSDLAIVFYLPDGTFIGIASNNANTGNDPVDIITISNSNPNPGQLKIGLELVSGPNPRRVKYVMFNSGSEINDFATNSSTIVGHANAESAIATGAAPWFNTPEFNPNVSEPILEPFSSAGNTPIFFDTSGNRTFQFRFKPEVVGPDAGNTTFFQGDLGFPVPGTTEPDGFPNFFGTSASAPHVAGVVALMLENASSLTPFLAKLILQLTAVDMNDPLTPNFDFGYDEASGFGFVDANAAVSFAGFFKTKDVVSLVKSRQIQLEEHRQKLKARYESEVGTTQIETKPTADLEK